MTAIDSPLRALPRWIPGPKGRVAGEALDILAPKLLFAMGGGPALYMYTGIEREFHDLDLHVVPAGVEPALRSLQEAGFQTWVKHPQWLAQAEKDGVQVDFVFGQGSWHESVDASWLERAKWVRFLGRRVRVLRPEELFWSKALRCSRLRHDSADLFHIVIGQGRCLDWAHLVALFGDDWEVLLSHLVMFRYAFPADADVVPDTVLDDLLGRMGDERRTGWDGPPVCRGQILDTSGAHQQYVDERGYVDERQMRWERRLREEPVLRRLVEMAASPPAGSGNSRSARTERGSGPADESSPGESGRHREQGDRAASGG